MAASARPGRSAKCRCHSRWLMTTARGRPSASSAAVSGRPIAGATPSSPKKFALTYWRFTSSPPRRSRVTVTALASEKPMSAVPAGCSRASARWSRGDEDDPRILVCASPSRSPRCESARPSGHPGLSQVTRCSDAGCRTGRGLRIAASTRPKIAVFAPIPNASVSTTATVTIQLRRSWRPAIVRSRSTPSSQARMPAARTSSLIDHGLPKRSRARLGSPSAAARMARWNASSSSISRWWRPGKSVRRRRLSSGMANSQIVRSTLATAAATSCQRASVSARRRRPRGVSA
jgi:hypothetical protein